ncbi:MAG: nucleoside-diphosphate kinase [Candidatus Micrarchaeota archaeon]|nr:nucleoside-diphosphate kinase [Candidatus Micrarchaeota archaeon]
MERTLIILKPDCVQRGLCGAVLERFERRGFQIAAMKMMRLSRRLLEEHYAHLKGKPFFESLVEFMSSSPVVVAIIEGKDAVEIVRKMCGATNARNAENGTIRGDFALSTQCNIIHASDSKETAKKEIERFFKEDEIFSYERLLGKFTYSKDERE